MSKTEDSIITDMPVATDAIAAEAALKTDSLKTDSQQTPGKGQKKTPLILKVFAILMIITAVLTVPALVLSIIAMVLDPTNFFDYLSATTFVISIVLLISLAGSGVLAAIFGINLLRNKLRAARQILEILAALTVGSMLCELMLDGLSAPLLSYLIRLIIFVVVAIYIDPALSEERKLQRKLRDMETREDAEEGSLGRDTSGKGYLKLDFLNIFWIFVIGCIVGYIIETVYFLIVFGVYENRTGMLYGPFSPIYGFGALLMTIALNRLYKKPIILVFFLSALIGGSFEALVSWFLEFAFGIVAWDYTGTWLSIGGRTNGYFMIMWGVLGCVWVKFLLPYLLKLVNLIPWNWRYTVTTVFAAVMITNGLLTLAAYDCWYQRKAGVGPANAIEQFCGTYYSDEFMGTRFESMSIDPSRATRH